MIYQQLSPTYKNDVIVEALYAREMEYFHYQFDADNFQHIIANSEPGPYRDDVEHRLRETLKCMQQVRGVYAALQAQITDPEAHAAAVARAIEKRKVKP